MRHASLFTGIGGFDLAAHWMGWTNVFQVEIDPFCQQILAKRFPQTDKHIDVKAFDGAPYRGSVDIISGGFPCQPYSAAGKRLGKADARHLWPEMLRIICEVRPTYVVGENVYGLLNWNGGMVFEEVKADLASQGYQVARVVLPACAVGADHQRKRTWIVAYADGFGFEGGVHAENGEIAIRNDSKPLHGRENEIPTWENILSKPRICGGIDGFSSRMDRLRIKALGNAIVPQVVYQIFKTIVATTNPPILPPMYNP